MVKKGVLIYIVFSLLIPCCLFSQMAELPFADKVKNASDIIEGKVLRTSCFRNASHSLIYTSNIVEVYKIFKGSNQLSEVEVITEGGQMDNEIQGSGSSLNITVGDIGIFMLEPLTVDAPGNKRSAYRVYGDAQGFIKYELPEKTAADPFKKYTNISKEVYGAIHDQTGKSYQTIKTFDEDPAYDKGAGKKRCRFWCSKRKGEKKAGE